MTAIQDLFISGAARRWGARLVAFSALAAAPAALGAQEELQGRVVRGPAGVAAAPVELHRVTQRERGVVARTTAGPDGRFTLALPPPADSGFTVYFATSVVSGVRYFGPALHGDSVPAGYTVQAYDTTSARGAADSVVLARRDLILSAAADGGWEVAELVRVRNPTARTLVPAQTRPVVGFPLPAGAASFEAGDGESAQPQGDSAGAGGLVKVGGTAWISAPLVPGERDFVFRYRIPASPQRVAITVAQLTDSLSVYLRQPAPDAEIRGIPEVEELRAEGERFRRFSGAALRPGTDVALDWRGPAASPIDARWAALALAAVILVCGAWMAWRRPREG